MYTFSASAPLSYEADVIVVGGGLAGCGAALAAARNGAKTLLIEKDGMLGGMATLGHVSPLDATHKLNDESFGGICEEIVEETRNMTLKYGGDSYFLLKVAPELLRLVLLSKLNDAGVEILFHASLIGAHREDRKIDHIYLSTKSGIEAAKAKVYIDTTGDADLVAFVGEEFVKGSEPGVFDQLYEGELDKIHFNEGKDEAYGGYNSDGLMQPVSVMFTMGNVDCEVAQQYVNKFLTYADVGTTKEEVMKLSYFGKVGFEDNGEYLPLPQGRVLFVKHGVKGRSALINMSRVINVDGTNAKELSKAENDAQMQIIYLCDFLRRFIPGFENAYLQGSSHTLGVRETRRLKGRYVLKGTQAIFCEKFEDTVAGGSYIIDIHDPQGKKKAIGGRLKGDYYDIPYGCLVPKNTDNLLVAGRCISVDHIAHSSTRIQGTCVMTGQAAGTAAAVSVKENKGCYDIDVSEVQKILRESGVNI
ncbi:MAG: FAD-dependent oxidoreductase [Acutalibacteraceae bacterium]|nr:FAD-dependent oxidoreductase [Acutalibacteraceae bacterium]